MNKFRTVVSVVIMVLAAVVGMFVGMAVNEGLNGAVLFSMITDFAYTVYAIDNRDKSNRS